MYLLITYQIKGNNKNTQGITVTKKLEQHTEYVCIWKYAIEQQDNAIKLLL